MDSDTYGAFPSTCAWMGLSRLTAKPPSHDPQTRMAPLPSHVEGDPGSFCAFPALDRVSAISPRTLMFTDHGLGARAVCCPLCSSHFSGQS